MADYLLDTNHLSRLILLGHPLRHRLEQRLSEGDTFAVAVPCVTELLFGLAMLPRSKQNLESWRILHPRLDYYDVKLDDAELAADLQVALRRRGWQLETVDAMIAAVALRNDLTLLTTDKDFAAVPDLAQENWRA